MHLLIKFPTRGRPNVFRRTITRYMAMASGKHKLSFIVTMDADDGSMNNNRMHQFLSRRRNVTFHYGNSRSKVQAINANLVGVDFDIILLASDDMLPEKANYDEYIVGKMKGHYPDLDGVLHYNDGIQGASLNTLSIMGKKMYDQFGYIYHPDYLSLWCDNEFTIVTKAMDKTVYDDTLLIRHAWTNVTGEDQLHKRNQALNDLDRAIFLERERRGFPKESVIDFLPEELRNQRRAYP